MAAGENRFAPKLNKKEVIELLKRNTREHKERHKLWHENISRKDAVSVERRKTKGSS